MYGPGQPLDLGHTFVVISDNIGAGGSSKPSDGLRMAFPHYQHSDVVRAQHDLVTNQLGIQQLHAVIGNSYGGRLSWQWGMGDSISRSAQVHDPDDRLPISTRRPSMHAGLSGD
jgi:homoserine O-acetyltransferase